MSYPPPDLPADSLNEVAGILAAHGLGDATVALRVAYQSLPASPPSRRAGLEDIYVFSRGGDELGMTDAVPSGSGLRDNRFDGLMIVCVALSIHMPPWLGGNDADELRTRIRGTVRNVVDALNGRWLTRGKTSDSVPGGPWEFSRCPIHFLPTISIDLGESCVGPFAGPIAQERTETAPVACLIQLSRAAVPMTRWKTEAGQAELGTGAAFVLDVPVGARSRITIQNLRDRIDQYHTCNALGLSERIARIREIRTGARAFLELEGEVGEAWARDTAIGHGEYPAEKAEIEGGIRICHEARDGDLSERLEHLERLRACCARYRPGETLKRGWRASPFTVEIDSALVAYEDLAPTSYRERIGALEVLQTRCAEFSARALPRNRYFYRHLHKLVPDVEGLALRARKTMGEIALSQGVARLIASIDVKAEELGVLRAARALAARAGAVERDLDAQMNSVTLLVDFGDDAEPAGALDCALRAHLPALFGIEKPVDMVDAEDLAPLVRRVLPMDAEVSPLT
ncbi:MAG: hypothetical protein JNK74_07655 [Candidatus Hydrogenedentes bacterium]|nr:hypothetical protein [Candidatus Hydrogenedentota bacterium]